MPQPRFVAGPLMVDAYTPGAPGGRQLGDVTSLTPLLSLGAKAFAGTVQVGTTPVSGRLVRVYDRATGQLLRQTRSDGAGQYAVPSLTDARSYYVVGLDNQPGGQNAAVADDVRPA